MRQNSQRQLDFSIGHPSFLQEYWREHLLQLHASPQIANLNLEDMDYWDAKKFAAPELEHLILNLHESIGNAETKGRQVVIGNGATQILAASLYALGKRNYKNVGVRTPYWPKFDPIVAMGGFTNPLEKFSNVYLPGDNKIELVVAPNNPDGSYVPSPTTHQKIFDLCYNWPQYSTVKHFDEDVMIFSLAKATGHASTRIGWALIKDTELAADMKEFIDNSTSGFSIEAERSAVRVITHQLTLPASESVFNVGKAILHMRWHLFHKVLKAKLPEVNILNPRQGLFAWCKVDSKLSAADYIQELANAKVAGGLAFGADESFFRFNLGGNVEDFKTFLKRVSADNSPSISLLHPKTETSIFKAE